MTQQRTEPQETQDTATHGESSAAPFVAPITPLARIETPQRERTEREFEQSPISQIPGEREFEALMKMAKMLAESGFVPKKLNTAGKVLAVILSGRELGLPPMLALRSIRISEEGNPIVAADVLLGAFKRSGGRSKWMALSDRVATIYLKHPNGDEHTESFTIEMAGAAGLLGKENWKKYKQAMLRSRTITAGLKSLGWEPAAGVYDADEAEEIAASQGRTSMVTAVVTPAGEVEATDTEPAAPSPPDPVRLRGKLLDEKKEDKSGYAVSRTALKEAIEWAGTKISESADAAAIARFEEFIRQAKAEIERRQIEDGKALEQMGADDTAPQGGNAANEERAQAAGL